MSSTEARRFSIVRAVSAMLEQRLEQGRTGTRSEQRLCRKGKAAGIQRQAENSLFLPMEVQKRDMTVGTTTAGGHMVATTLRPQDFIELLRNATLLKSLGARTLSGLVGNADITKQTGAATGYWLSTEATRSPRASRPSACCSCGRKCWAPTPRFPACCCSKARRMPTCS
jgi:hypothetical protein